MTRRCAKKNFDFSDEVDNGWHVSTQDSPFLVTRNSDGKQFVVGKGGDEGLSGGSKYEDKSVLPLIDRELEQDLKRFSSVANILDVEASQNKRYCLFDFM